MGRFADQAGKKYLILLLTWLAAALRFFQLGVRSLWFDEAFSWLCATAPFPEAIEFALTNFVHPPLYYLLLRPIMWIGDREFQLRLLSAWVGVTSVPLLYSLGCRMADRSTGLLAAALLALNPFHIWFSQEARMYTLLFILALGVGYFFGQVIEAGKWRNWIGLGFISGLAYVTHYFSLLLPLAQFAFILWRFRRYHHLLRRWVMVQALAAVPLTLWLYCLSRLPEQAMGIGWIPRPVIWDLFLTLWNFSLGFPDRFSLLVGLGFLPFAAALTQAACSGRHRGWWWVWLAGPLLFVLLLSWGTGRYFYVDRFFIICLPAYLLLVAWGVIHLPRPWLQRGVAAALLAASLAGTIRLCLDPALVKEDWRGASAFVNQFARPGDRLVVDRQEWTLLVRYYGCSLPATSLSSVSLQQSWESSGRDDRIWLLYRHPGESAHIATRVWPFDIFEDADPSTATWLQMHRDDVTEHLRLAGIDVVLIEAESN
jgi:mannosyltransferase